MSKEIETSIRYLENVLVSNNPSHIFTSTEALLDSLSKYCGTNSNEMKSAIINFLKLLDQKYLLEQDVDATTLKNSLRNIQQVSLTSTSSNNNTKPNKKSIIVSDADDLGLEIANPESIDAANDNNIDNLLKQLNLKKIPSFSPTFAEIENDSDDENGLTTKQKEEERAEKHGQKVCEEEVVKLPDGREIRMKKTKTVQFQQTTKHVTISTRGGCMPEVSRSFMNAKRDFDEDEDNECTAMNACSMRHRFRPFQSMLSDCSDDDQPESLEEVGESKKSKTVERTSQVSQKVSEKKERDGRLLAECEASKLDKSNLFAQQVDQYKGNTLVNRTGAGDYEEESHIFNNKGEEVEANGTPKTHVVNYMRMFGDEPDKKELDYLKGKSITSYISLNDKLKNHEEKYKTTVQFEFNCSGGSSATIDLNIVSDILNNSDFESLILPTKYVDDATSQSNLASINWHENDINDNNSTELCCELDVSDYMVYRSILGNKREVRGGPKDAIVVFATQTAKSSKEYQEAFIITYRSFISSIELINKLIKRYIYMSLTNDDKSISAAKNTFCIIVRVIDELSKLEVDTELTKTLTSFIYRLILDGNMPLARILRDRFIDRFVGPVDISELYAFNPNNIKSKKSMDLFDFKSAEIAQQLTYIDEVLFQRIDIAELLWWVEKQNAKYSPNLSIFTQQFNNLSFWVRTMIVTKNSHRERERYVNKFLKIMKNLKEMGNLNSYLAILSALLSTPVYRLDWNKSIREQIKEQECVLDTSQSNKCYRELLQNTPPPCIPYVGIVLQDLTFIDSGNPKMVPQNYSNGRHDLINFLKQWNQYAILSSVRKFKQWNYKIEKNDAVFQFFDSFKARLNDDETWEASYKIKKSSRAANS